ncbi:ATPase PAAT [Hippocampus zosterae]|uniref:ATPase PAAT n=1 Tax=Hippocampus zosterae TaxID=109293 RepID=UPI00223D317A|nr:ATPase PAAT [Hippocampus zosterae]
MAVASGVTVDVKVGTAWQCRSGGTSLADVVLMVNVTAPDDDSSEEEQKLRQTLGGDGVLLERADGDNGEPCVVTLSCVPAGLAAIGRLTLISEARTMEVYLPTGEYCGTVRGHKQDDVQHGDRGPFYRKQLSLDDAPSSCDVKLLSLAGRSSVLLRGVVVALRPPQRTPHQDGGGAAGTIDLLQVQSLVDEMGGTLSPGAQNLMETLRLQQKNQSSFLPLLMGGGLLSTLAPPPNVGTAAAAAFQHPSDSVRPTAQAPPNGPPSDVRLSQMMRHFLSGGQDDGMDGVSPDNLLREICAQLAPLKVDQNNTQTADASMESRLEEMERRLKEHVDSRLDALEHKLDKVLLAALQQAPHAAPPPADPSETKVHESK